MAATHQNEQILIFAPIGRDAILARDTLERAGIAAEVCADLDELSMGIQSMPGGILVTQEALTPEATSRLLQVLERQPPWSDLPVIVLVSRGVPLNRQLSTLLSQMANATFHERPVPGSLLVQAAQIALRARRRQYELRNYISALAQAEEAEHQARSLAEEAVRVRDDFLASVTHDLKNPLGAARGYAQLMRRQVARQTTPDPEKLTQGLVRIESIIDRAVAQLDELLDIARLQAGQELPLVLDPVDLIALARQVCEEAQPVIPDQAIGVHTELTELYGVWDGRRLHRVLANLLNNAIKYSPEGGEIAVGINRTSHEGQPFARLTVQDHGIGIPAKDLPHVFERFYRASNVADQMQGTGLGLAGVRQIIEQHGGTISVESEEGKGSAFTVLLPAL